MNFCLMVKSAIVIIAVSTSYIAVVGTTYHCIVGICYIYRC